MQSRRYNRHHRQDRKDASALNDRQNLLFYLGAIFYRPHGPISCVIARLSFAAKIHLGYQIR